jgi:hypothetical protein
VQAQIRRPVADAVEPRASPVDRVPQRRIHKGHAMQFRRSTWLVVAAACMCFVSCFGVMFLSQIVPAQPQPQSPATAPPTQPPSLWLLDAAVIALPIGLLAVLVIMIMRRFGRQDDGVPRCPKCQHDLRGVTAAGCPECGWNRDLSKSDSDEKRSHPDP